MEIRSDKIQAEINYFQSCIDSYKIMYYILVTEMESPGSSSCKVQGLNPLDLMTLEGQLTSLNIAFNKQEKFHEIDTEGVMLLNLLAGNNYRVCGQSMVIEKSNIGGRTTQVQKIVWILNKE